MQQVIHAVQSVTQCGHSRSAVIHPAQLRWQTSRYKCRHHYVALPQCLPGQNRPCHAQVLPVVPVKQESNTKRQQQIAALSVGGLELLRDDCSWLRNSQHVYTPLCMCQHRNQSPCQPDLLRQWGIRLLLLLLQWSPQSCFAFAV